MSTGTDSDDPEESVEDPSPGLRDRLGAALRSVETAEAVAGMDDRISRWRRERKVGKGTLRATQVVAYRGWVAAGTARLRVRVIEEPPIPDAGDWLPYVDVLKANTRRFVALPLPGVRVTLTIGEATAEAVSDRRGYAVARLPVPALRPGWHEYHCATVPDDADEEPAVATGAVLLPDPRAEIAVVSDIDDTVLRTGLTEGLVAVRRTLFRDASSRRPVPGMSALYRGLHRGTGPGPAPSFWYLSTGPWAMYDLLTQFLGAHHFPSGPLLLTDWGANERYVIRSGREHKRAALERLFGDVTGSDVVLIGDSGQGDAEVYVEAARNHPGRCAAIVLLDVGEHMADRAAELQDWSAELAEEGIAFHLVPDAVGAARVLARLGLVAAEVVDAVRAAAADEA